MANFSGGQVIWELDAVSKGFDAKLAAASRSVGSFSKNLDDIGKKTQNAGKKLTKFLTVPILGVGTAALKTFTDFDASLGKIEGLVGVSRDQVDAWGNEVLKLGGKIGKPPAELADALFSVTSAGFRAEEAIQVLTIAGKASAAGLGETRDIAQALTGAINAYGSDVLDAAKATDIIVATARAGNFETSQFAGALGRVTPFAKAAGASFDDIGGSVALLTRVNNDAIQSVTQISALFRAFAAPTKQTQDALGKLGLTTDGLRKKIGEQGLVKTLQELDKRLGGNRDKLREIIPDSQGFSAALTILDAKGEDIKDTFGAVRDSVGITDEAFKAAEKTARNKFNKAIASLQASLIKTGAAIAPFAIKLSDAIRRITERFTKLNPEQQKTVVIVGAVAAALGPVIFLVGSLTRAVAGLGLVFSLLAKNKLILAITLITIVVVALTAKMRGLNGVWELLRGIFKGVMRILQPIISGFTALIRIVEKVTGKQILSARATDTNTEAMKRQEEAEKRLKDAKRALVDAQFAQEQSQLDQIRAQREVTRLEKEGRTKTLDYRQAKLDLARANLDLKDRTNEATEAEKKQRTAAFNAASGVEQLQITVDKTAERMRVFGRITSNVFNTLPQTIRDKLAPLGSQIRSIFGGIASNVSQSLKNIGKAIGQFNVPNIPIPSIKLPDFKNFFADGVQNFSGGLAVVGERGPELVNLPRGSDVIPNHQIGSAGNNTFNITMSGVMSRSRSDERDIAKSLVERINEELRAKSQREIGGGSLRGFVGGQSA